MPRRLAGFFFLVRSKKVEVTMRLVAIVTLVTLVSTSALSGCAVQTTHSNFNQITPARADLLWGAVRASPSNSSVAVELETGERVRVNYRSADDQEVLMKSGGQLLTFERSTIRRVTLEGGSNSGWNALWGLGVGGGVGLIWGATCDNSDCDGVFSVLVSAVFAGIGAGIGALIGVFDRDRTVVYEKPGLEGTV